MRLDLLFARDMRQGSTYQRVRNTTAIAEASTTASVRESTKSRMNRIAPEMARNSMSRPPFASREPVVTISRFMPWRTSLRCKATGAMSSAAAQAHSSSVIT